MADHDGEDGFKKKIQGVKWHVMSVKCLGTGKSKWRGTGFRIICTLQLLWSYVILELNGVDKQAT